MKRTVITMDGNGELSIPSNLKDLWMSEGELVDMLHVTAPKLHAVIRSIYRTNSETLLSSFRLFHTIRVNVSISPIRRTCSGSPAKLGMGLPSQR